MISCHDNSSLVAYGRCLQLSLTLALVYKLFQTTFSDFSVDVSFNRHRQEHSTCQTISSTQVFLFFYNSEIAPSNLSNLLPKYLRSFSSTIPKMQPHLFPRPDNLCQPPQTTDCMCPCPTLTLVSQTQAG